MGLVSQMIQEINAATDTFGGFFSAIKSEILLFTSCYFLDFDFMLFIGDLYT